MPTTITLRNFHQNELEYILREQLKNRLSTREGYSLENTVLKIVREHEKLKTEKTQSAGDNQ